MTDRKNNVSEELMRRIWRREYGMEFDRAEFERQRAIANWMRRNREAMIARDEAERIRAQQEQQAQPRQTTSD